MARRPAAHSRHVALDGGWAWPALIVAFTLLSFSPVLGNDFVNWDDPFYFTSNLNYQGLTATHLRWMFTTLYMGHYQPLSWLTHAVVFALRGTDPRAFHGVNLLLHAANGVVLYGLIIALLREAWRDRAPLNRGRLRAAAAVGALFFTLHPLRVEAVAWAAERQEVLCTLFFLLSLRAYVQMHAARRCHRQWRGWYMASIACFAFSLMSKAAGLLLPLVLVVLDVYPLQRLVGARTQRWRLLVEKVPFLALAGGAAVLVYLAKQPQTVVPLTEHGVLERVMQAMYGLSFYLWKTLIPLRLSPLYPLPHPLHPARPVYVLSALVVVTITAGTIAARRRYPWALAAWLCYVAIVLPVLGLVQAGPQIAADRYTYLSCLTWSFLIAAGLYRWRLIRQSGSAGWPLRPLATAVVAALLCVLGLLTRAQSGVWHDSLTLWTHVLQLEPDSEFAHHNRGQVRYMQGNTSGALADYDAAIRIDPTRGHLFVSRGIARQAVGDLDGALADFNEAMRLEPNDATAYSNRASVRYARGDTDSALSDLDTAIRLEPTYAQAYHNRGGVRYARGDVAAALADFDTALRLNPTYVRAYQQRAAIRQAQGNLSGAVSDFSAALQLTPPGTTLHATLATQLAAARRALGPPR
jgi:tetratricopeptide (TPR) repeat protein